LRNALGGKGKVPGARKGTTVRVVTLQKKEVWGGGKGGHRVGREWLWSKNSPKTILENLGMSSKIKKLREERKGVPELGKKKKTRGLSCRKKALGNCCLKRRLFGPLARGIERRGPV